MFPGMHKTFEEWSYMEWKLSKAVNEPWILKHGDIVHASGTLIYIGKSLIGVEGADHIRKAIFHHLTNQVAEALDMKIESMKVET